MALLFEDAAKAKDAIMASQQKEIQMLYLNWAEDIADKAEFYSHKTNASAALSERYYKELYNQMKATNKQLGQEIQGLITSNMYTIADSVVASNVNWLKEFGFSEDGLNAAFSYIPNDVVQRLITGQIYQGGWNLSQRIWSDSQQTQSDVYQIMARGLAEQKSVYEIAKDLESYVRPGAKKNWNPILAMRNTKTGEIEYKRLYKSKVDYSAQRLARTLAQHSYQQSFIATTQNNPFIMSYRWHSNGSRVCELCLARDGKIYKKDELPMDHPNGMCTMEPIVADDMVEQLANWFNSPDGTYPDIDAFAGNFGYEAAKSGTVQSFIDKYGKSTKSPNAWFNSLTPIQKAEAKVLKDQSGLTWNKWYEQNIYEGDGSNLGGKTQKVLAFTSAQEKYLAPYGFTPTNMPKTFDDWSYKVGYEKASEILKSMGTDWSDPHPYQKLMQFYNANLASSNLTTKTVAAKKTAGSIGKAFDASAWADSLRKNNLGEMNDWTRAWVKAISGNEKYGVEVYTGSAYRDMNRFLRGQSSKTSYADEIKLATSALKKASLPRDVIVRRGSGYNMLNDLGVGRITPENKSNFIGAIVQDKGFVSTSPAPSGGFTDDIEYIIKLPKGSQAMYVDSISRHMGEEELLINRGGKYIVEDVEFNNWGDVRKIYMTLKNLK